MSAYRSAQIYVSTRTIKRLRLINRIFPQRSSTDNTATASLDEVADAILNEAILTKWPECLELEKELARVEAEFAEKMKQ